MKINNDNNKIEEHFNNSLSRFVKDFACKNEVIAKFNNKKPISQIAKELSFPISEESIVQIIWEYLIEKNIILLNPPDSENNQQYDFVKREGQFGKTYFERVSHEAINKKDYELVDIAKLKKEKIKDDFLRELIEKLPFEKHSYYIKKGQLNLAQ